MANKVLMLKGLPASGKSTYARKIVKSGNYVRVNRDDIRAMAFGDTYNNRRGDEKVVVRMETNMARAILEKGKSVVVDDTNLGEYHAQMWADLAKDCNAKFEPKSVMKVKTLADVEELIRRDAGREKTVGSKVITDMAFRYNIPREYLSRPFIVSDIDGTVANCEHRRHLVRPHETINGGAKNWNEFFSRMDEDSPRSDVIERVINFTIQERANLIFVTARPADYYDMTSDWIKAQFQIHNKALYNTLFPGGHVPILMRNKGDSRPDTFVKREIYKTFLSRLDIRAVYDDRPSVIETWEELGLHVIDVGDGVPF